MDCLITTFREHYACQGLAAISGAKHPLHAVMIPVASKQQSMKLLATTVTKKLDHYNVYLLTKGIYIHSQGEWKYYPSSVKKQEGRIKYQTDDFTVVKKRIGESEMIEAKGEIRFHMQEKLSCVQS